MCDFAIFLHAQCHLVAMANIAPIFAVAMEAQITAQLILFSPFWCLTLRSATEIHHCPALSWELFLHEVNILIAYC